MTDLSDKALAAMLAYCEEATEGPWEIAYFSDKDWPGIHGWVQGVGHGVAHVNTYRYEESVPEGFASPDSEFITNARTDFPAIIRELQTARAQLAEADRALRMLFKSTESDAEALALARQYVAEHPEGEPI